MFVTGREQISAHCQKRRQVYKPPSLVLRPPQGGRKCPKAAAPRPQNPKGAGKHPWGLPALVTEKQDRAGRSMAAHEMRRSS